jgi:two-component system NtrC family sensor kinase
MSSTQTANAKPNGQAAGAVQFLLPFTDAHVMRGILDAMPARVSYFDKNRKYRYNNHEFYRFTGLTPEQTIGRSVAQVLGRHTSAETLPQVQAVRRGETTRTEGWRQYKGMGLRYVESVFIPLFYPDGSMDGYFVLVRDLTDEQRHKEELQRRGQQIEGILREIDDAVAIFDTDLRLVMCNQGWLELKDFPKEMSVPGTKIEAFIRSRLERGMFYGDEIPGLPIEETIRHQVEAHKRIKHETNQIYQVRGRWLNIRRRRLPDGSLLITHTDITAKYEADRAKRAQIEAMQRVAQMETNATLLAGLGHEINNPLAAIMAQASMLLRETQDAKSRQRVEAIHEAAERGAKIVHSLMRSARRREQRYEPLDIPASIQLALELAWNDGPPPWLDFTLDIAPKLPKPYGDPEQIAHVVSNLVSNATQALEAARMPGPKRLGVSVEMAGDDMMIRIADNGPGVPAELRERVFEPFFTTKPPEKGTGVGLALCRALARAHGGSLNLEDTPGGGASFILRLPLR